MKITSPQILLNLVFILLILLLLPTLFVSIYAADTNVASLNPNSDSNFNSGVTDATSMDIGSTIAEITTSEHIDIDSPLIVEKVGDKVDIQYSDILRDALREASLLEERGYWSQAVDVYILAMEQLPISMVETQSPHYRNSSISISSDQLDLAEHSELIYYDYSDILDHPYATDIDPLLLERVMLRLDSAILQNRYFTYYQTLLPQAAMNTSSGSVVLRSISTIAVLEDDLALKSWSTKLVCLSGVDQIYRSSLGTNFSQSINFAQEWDTFCETITWWQVRYALESLPELLLLNSAAEVADLFISFMEDLDGTKVSTDIIEEEPLPEEVLRAIENLRDGLYGEMLRQYNENNFIESYQMSLRLYRLTKLYQIYIDASTTSYYGDSSRIHMLNRRTDWMNLALTYAQESYLGMSLSYEPAIVLSDSCWSRFENYDISEGVLDDSFITVLPRSSAGESYEDRYAGDTICVAVLTNDRPMLAVIDTETGYQRQCGISKNNQELDYLCLLSSIKWGLGYRLKEALLETEVASVGNYTVTEVDSITATDLEQRELVSFKIKSIMQMPNDVLLLYIMHQYLITGQYVN